MSLNELDVIVRVAAATLLGWMALGRGLPGPGGRRFFLPLALCLIGFLAGNTPEPGLRLSGPAGWAGMMLAGYAAVFLWWWCLAVFDHAFRPRGAVLIAGGAWFLIASADRGMFGPAPEAFGLSRLLIALGLGMVAQIVWRLLRDRAGDLIDHRRAARRAVVFLLAGQLLADLAIDLTFGFNWGPQAFTVAQNTTLMIFVAWLLALDPRWTVLRPARIEPASPPVAPETEAARRLCEVMADLRPHLEPDMTFDRFTRIMDLPDRTLRRLIRDQGHDHFRSFLNAYRVEEAKRCLASPEHRDDKLIAVAMDSGFASLASFNRVFKELVGRTPSDFRATAQGSEQRSADF